MKCKCKICWYVISIILLICLLIVNVWLYVKQAKYLNFSIAQVGWKENWERLEKIYNTDKYKQERTDSMAQEIATSLAYIKAQYGEDTSATNTDNNTVDNSNQDVSAVVEDMLATAPVNGNKDARFTIIEYSELLCGFCQRQSVNGVIDTVMAKFPGEVNNVHRHFIVHAAARDLASAMECVAELKPDAYYDTLKQAFQNAPASVDSIISIAANLGADKNKLQTCFDEWRHLEAISTMENLWRTLFGIQGTPGNIIYDRETWKYQVLPWAYPADDFIQVIENMKK